jgi:hypothetical protein
VEGVDEVDGVELPESLEEVDEAGDAELVLGVVEPEVALDEDDEDPDRLSVL